MVDLFDIKFYVQRCALLLRTLYYMDWFCQYFSKVENITKTMENTVFYSGGGFAKLNNKDVVFHFQS